jgi:hypothetical protein
MNNHTNEVYLRSAIGGIAEEIRTLQPGAQATELYNRSVRAGALLAEHQAVNLLIETEQVFVEAAMRMSNDVGKPKWTEKQTRKHIRNGLEDGLSKSSSNIVPYPPSKVVGKSTPPCILNGRDEGPEQQPGETDRFLYKKNGHTELCKIRFATQEGKYKPFYRLGGTDQWQNMKPEGFQDIPYNYDMLVDEEHASEVIYLTEGERDAQTIIKEGLLATTYGSAGYFPAGQEGFFTDRDVVIIGDADEAGSKHVKHLTDRLGGVARGVKSFIPQKSGVTTPAGYDITDWFRDGGTRGELDELVENPAPVLHREPRPRFWPMTIDEILDRQGREWLVEGLLPSQGIAMIYGSAGSGKSFLALDLAMAVASGGTWAGKRIESGTAIYLVAEGQPGFTTRVAAYTQTSGKPMGFRAICSTPNLAGKEGDTAEFIRTVQEASTDFPHRVRLVVVDTMGMVLDGADENSAGEMGVFLYNVQQIATELDCLVVLIHHTGKDGDKGARGSSALPARMDAEWRVSKTSNGRNVRITKNRDGQDGLELPFELREVSLTEDGSSCVVNLGHWGWRQSKAKADLTSLQLLQHIREALKNHGQSPPTSLQLSCQVVSREIVRKLARDNGWATGKSEAAWRKTFGRSLDNLKKHGHIDLKEDFIWTMEADTGALDGGPHGIKRAA